MNPAPPKISAPRPDTRWVLATLAVAGLGLAVLVYCFNPSAYAFYPVCQFHRLTGWNCPGCGMTRAVHALLHGDLAAALRQNALLVMLAAALLARGLWLVGNRLRGKTNGEFFPVKYLWPLLALMAIFAVLRNLPAGAFLAP